MTSNHAKNGIPEDRDPDQLDQSKLTAVGLYVYNPATLKMVAVRVGELGGGSFPTITASYPPESLTVGAGQAQLTIPADATDATVIVVSGSVRRSIGGNASTSTPLLGAGDSEQISGAELDAYRLTREGGSDATVSIEYRKVN